jgi:hypothetical protein
VPLLVFSDVIAQAPQLVEVIARNNEMLRSLESDRGVPLRSQLSSVAELDVPADSVLIAFLIADPVDVAAGVFALADLFDVMLDHQRRKFMSSLVGAEHKRLAVAASGYLFGQLTAAELAAQAGIAVPPGRPALHPRPEAGRAAREVTVYSGARPVSGSAFTPPHP